MDAKKVRGAGLDVVAKRNAIDYAPSSDIPSIRRQCELLELNRSSLYYEPRPNKCKEQEDRDIRALIDELYMQNCSRGARQIRDRLRRRGYPKINRKRVTRLMRQMGISSVAPRPNTSKPHPGHKIYPYLLRNVKIDRVNHVWSTDITYIRLEKGYAYLCAIMDWYSRKILSWRLSNSLDSAFCIEALQEAMNKYGSPEIFNTDQGCQFTSQGFIDTLKTQPSIRISMDGRGRALDNIFIERVWRSLKYENVYLKHYNTIKEARQGIAEFFDDYNEDRVHQSLDGKTPSEVYHNEDFDRKKAS